MIRLYRLMFGYVSFCFSGGFIDGFVNNCYLEKINIHDLKIKDNSIFANCPVSEYKRLHRVALKNGGKVKIVKKHGLPFLLLRLKNRIGIMVGLLLFVVIINTLAGFVWNVEIVGNERLQTSDISAFLEQNGLHEGVHWHSFSSDKIENLMLASYEDIAWAHINRVGSTARVEINEAVIQPSVDDTEGYTNLKATKDGVITYINLKRGWQVVNIGDAVVKGDLLVSGVYENGQTQRNVFAHASGEVIAEVKEPFELTISRSQAERVYTDEKNYRAIYFFGITIGNCGKNGYENSTSTEYLTLNGKDLPIGIVKTTSRKYVDSEYNLTDDQLSELMDTEIEKQIKNLYPNCEILERNLTINLYNDRATAEGELKILENIAQEVKFY